MVMGDTMYSINILIKPIKRKLIWSILLFILTTIIWICIPTLVQAATIEKCGTIGSEVWTQDNTYIFTCEVIVPGGETLSIEEGTVVYIDNPSHYLMINGTLLAVGTSSNPVHFTNSVTGNYGGYLYLTDYSHNSVLDHVILERSEFDGIYLYTSSVSVSNSIIRDNKINGIYLGLGASPTITNTQITNNASHGIYIDNGSPYLDGLTITNSGINGINVQTGSPYIGYTTITGSGEDSISLFAESMYNLQGTNTLESVEIRGGAIIQDTTWHQGPTASFPYYMDGTTSVRESTTLTIEEGTVVYIDNPSHYLHINGTLNADGTSSKPIQFTNSIPSNYGGYVYLSGSSHNSVLDHVILERSEFDGIYLYTSSVSISNSTIRNNKINGVYLGLGASPSITNTQIVSNGDCGVYIYNGSPTIENSEIYGNTNYGVYNNNNSIIINAENNWWGDASGPLDDSDDRSTGGLYNPTGLGDRVSNYVDYEPWLGSPNPEEPVLSINPTSLDFGDTEVELTFEIKNLGSGNLDWAVSEDATWLGAHSASGSTGGDGIYSGSGDEVVTVTVGRMGLFETVYSADLILNSNGGNHDLSVRMVVGEPQGIISLGVLANLDATYPLRGSARVTNPRATSYQWYEVKFNLVKNGVEIATQTGYANSVPPRSSKKVSFDFGPQTMGTYEVVAELYIADGWLSTVKRTVAVSSAAHQAAFRVGENLTEAAHETLDEVRDDSSDILLEGIIKGGEGIISVFLTGILPPIQDALNNIDDVTGELLAHSLLELYYYLVETDSKSSNVDDPLLDHYFDEKISDLRGSIDDKRKSYESDLMSESFSWDFTFERLAKTFEEAIRNTDETVETLGIDSDFPFVHRTSFNKQVRTYKVHIHNILNTLSVIFLGILIVVAVLTLLAILASGPAAPAILGQLIGLGLKVAKIAKIVKSVSGVIGLILGLIIFFVGLKVVAPAVKDNHHYALNELSYEIQSASGQNFSDLKTAVEIKDGEIQFETQMENLGTDTAEPLVHTYLYNASGKLIRIFRHQPKMAAGQSVTLESELFLPPGEYRGVSVVHTKNDIGLTASDPILFTVDSLTLDLDVNLDKPQISMGEAIHATIMVHNNGVEATGDFTVAALYGVGGEGWTLNLNTGETQNIEYSFVPITSGKLQVSAISEWGIEEDVDVPYSIGGEVSLALNMDQEHIYEPGLNIEVPIQMINAGNDAFSGFVKSVTTDLNQSVIVYTDTHSILLPGNSSDTFVSTWLPNPQSGSYVTNVYIDDVYYVNYEYDVMAYDTIYANLYIDSYMDLVGGEIGMNLDIFNSSFENVNPDSASITMLAPDGTQSMIDLVHNQTGQYSGTHTTTISGTYTLDTEISSAGNHVVQDNDYFIAGEASDLLPDYDGNLFLTQVSPITITVVNEYDDPIFNASVTISGTKSIYHDRTDGLGMVQFNLVPETADPFHIILEKPGYSSSISELPVRVITDTLAPVLSVYLPELTNQNTLTVTGITEAGATLNVEGENVEVDSRGLFTTTVTLLEGENMINAESTDDWGNTTQYTGTVTLDIVPPSLSLSAPPDGINVQSETIQVVGITDEDAVITINDVFVEVQPGGSFSTWTLLTPGENLITTISTDEAGNGNIIERHVIYEVEHKVFIPLIFK
jgi:hypothetical protein